MIYTDFGKVMERQVEEWAGRQFGEIKGKKLGFCKEKNTSFLPGHGKKR